jgi:hypothetical protein
VRRALLVLGLILVGLGGLWGLPYLLAGLLRRETPSGPIGGHAVDDETLARVDRLVVDNLRAQGLSEPAAASESAGLRRRVYMVPIGVEPAQVGQRLRAAAAAEGVEAYASPVDGLDVELRVYAGAALRYHLVLVPTLAADPVAPPEPTLRMRPQLAIVVRGLGYADASRLLELPIPLSVCVEAYSPFALRTAFDATRRWHEVLVELPPQEAGAVGARVGEAFRAVPFASGVLGLAAPAADAGLPAASIVVLNGRAAPRPPPGARYTLVPAQGSSRLGAAQALLRARHLALQRGVATVVLDALDPDIVPALRWALRADQDGYRLVLASEAARSADVRGVPPVITAVGG